MLTIAGVLSLLLFMVNGALADSHENEANCTNFNEEYKSCGTACQLTCANFYNHSLICTGNCVEGCFCKAGFVREEANGICIRTEECPGSVLHALMLITI